MLPQPKRPLGITVLAITYLWIGGLGTPIFLLMVLVGGITGTIASALEDQHVLSHVAAIAAASLIGILWLSGYVLYAYAGYGLWKLRLAALKTTLVLHWIAIAGACIASLIVLHFAGVSLAVGILVFGSLIPAIILYYLTRPATRWPFEAAHAIARQLPIPVAPPVPTQRARWKTVGIIAAASFLAVGIFAYCLFSFVEREFRSTVVYTFALSHAQASHCVQQALGTPIVQKGSVSGSISISQNDGDAELSIPIRGPRGEGTLQLAAEKLDGSWTYKDLTLYNSAGQIHLLPEASPCETP